MTHKTKDLNDKTDDKSARKQETEAKRAVLDDLFDDIYSQRQRVYKINFVRGILFGAGSAIGGTFIIAIVLWVLSIFVNIPLVGELFRDAQQTIEQRSEQQ